MPLHLMNVDQIAAVVWYLRGVEGVSVKVEVCSVANGNLFFVLIIRIQGVPCIDGRLNAGGIGIANALKLALHDGGEDLGAPLRSRLLYSLKLLGQLV